MSQSTLRELSWPPEVDDEQIDILLQHVRDWQITHSSMLKLVWTEEEHTVMAQPIGVSLWPTLFPRSCFEEALSLAKAFNELYTAAACDEVWLLQTLKPLLTPGSFASKLWSIHERVKAEGYAQKHSLGIFRSDYMLHNTSPNTVPELKQVEFNTFSCAGACHSDQVSALHRHLNRIGAYQPSPSATATSKNPILSPYTLPKSNNTASLATALAAAHNAYGPTKSKSNSGTASQTGILMVVQPRNINICDERPLEYALWEEHSIPCYRAVFPDEIAACTSLSSNRELLYHSPFSRPHQPPLEISVVYFRAGLDEAEYSDDGDDNEGEDEEGEGEGEGEGTSGGVAARHRLERSRAIKCPSVLAHLATFKKVQQALAEPGAVARFLRPSTTTHTPPPTTTTTTTTTSTAATPAPTATIDTTNNTSDQENREKAETVRRIERTFMPLFALDDRSDTAVKARECALSEEAEGYVLKPSLEGGGHNVYGAEIGRFLRSVPEERWGEFVLMEMIRAPEGVRNMLVSPRGLYAGDVVSELGVLGVCLWSCEDEGEGDDGEKKSRRVLTMNEQAGFTFKTKASHVQEMSVVKGYGCFDSPCLVDDG